MGLSSKASSSEPPIPKCWEDMIRRNEQMTMRLQRPALQELIPEHHIIVRRSDPHEVVEPLVAVVVTLSCFAGNESIPECNAVFCLNRELRMSG